MIQVLILYINTLIVSLDVFEEITGLCEIIEKDQNGTTISFPAQYCDNGEYKAVEDYDISKGVVYHRLTGDVTEDEIESTTGCETNIKKTYPIRTVGVIKKDILKRKNDNNYIDDKIAGNIANSIAHSSVKSLMLSLKAEDISITVSKYSTNRYEIWNEEHKNIPMGLDFEYVYFSVDYNIIVEGSTACFDIYGCDTNAALVNGTITITNSVDCDQVADCMDDRLIAGDGVVLSYDDTLNKLTISTDPVWGDIGGTLSNQTDLQNALNAKLALAGGTMNGDISVGAGVKIKSSSNASNYLQIGGSGVDLFANSDIQISTTGGNLSLTGDLILINSPTLHAGDATFVNDQTGFVWNAGGSELKENGGDLELSTAGMTITASGGLILNSAVNFIGLTASRVPYIDASKNIVSSSVTPTELGYLSGVTSALQTQIDNNKWTYASVAGSDATTTSTTLVDVTGLSIALLANTVYEIEAVLQTRSGSTAGTGYGIDFSGAGASIAGIEIGARDSNVGRTTRINAFNTAYSVPWLLTFNVDSGHTIKAIVTVGANAGNLTVQHLKVTSGISTVYIGSFLKVKILS